MKRVKVMLLAIAVIAIASGTLAFKARYRFDYCTVAANQIGVNQYTCTTIHGTITAPLTCSFVLLGRKDAPELPVPVCTTSFAPTEPFGNPTCVNALNCATTKIVWE